MSFSGVPTDFTAATMATAMPPAIMAYSMAVAPRSHPRNLRKICISLDPSRSSLSTTAPTTAAIERALDTLASEYEFWVCRLACNSRTILTNLQPILRPVSDELRLHDPFRAGAGLRVAPAVRQRQIGLRSHLDQS